jgi:hypothetical protein
MQQSVHIIAVIVEGFMPFVENLCVLCRLSASDAMENIFNFRAEARTISRGMKPSNK